MSESVVNELVERARALSPDERVRLLDLVLASLHVDDATDDAMRAQDAEIERRIRMHERGEGTLHDADDVMAEARQIAP